MRLMRAAVCGLILSAMAWGALAQAVDPSAGDIAAERPTKDAVGRRLPGASVDAQGVGTLALRGDVCPPESGQEPGVRGYADFGIGATNISTFRAADNLHAPTGLSIFGELSWTGVFTDTDFENANPANPEADWIIRFYADDNGAPGALQSTFSTADGSIVVTAEIEPLGYSSVYDRYVLTASAGSLFQLAGQCMWIEISSDRFNQQGDAYFFWEESLEGDRVGYVTEAGSGFPASDIRPRNFALCLGTGVVIFPPQVADPGDCPVLHPAPANDDCFAATPLTLNSSYVTGTTLGATYDPIAGNCGLEVNSRGVPLVSGANAPGVWYTVTGTGGDIRVDTCDSEIDTILAVYCGDCESLQCVDASDDGCDLQSSVTFESVAGETYYVFVSAFSDQYLETFSIRAIQAFGGATQAPPCVDCEIAIPMDALSEGEMCDTGAGGVNDINGGCNSSPPTFAPNVDCAVVIHGTAWARDGVRDTDWYTFTITEQSVASFEVEAEFPPSIILYDSTGAVGGTPINCGGLTAARVADAFSERCGTVRIEELLQPGTYSLFVGPQDFSGVVCGTNNDYVLRMAACEVSDLSPGMLSVPSVVEVGEPFTVTYVTENLGNRDVTANWNELLRINPSVGTEYTAGQFFQQQTLVAGGQTLRTFSGLTIASGRGDGTFGVRVLVDSGNTVFEDDESNNEVSGTIQVVGPDLEVVSISVSGNFFPGGLARCIYTIRNRGDRPFEGTRTDRIRLRRQSDDVVFDSVAPQNVGSIGAGSSAQFLAEFSIPQSTSYLDEFYFEVEVNTDGAVVETVLTNNGRDSGDFEIGGADLTVEVTGVTDPVALGGPTTVSYRVTNIGDRRALADNVVLNIRVSDDLVVAGDRLLATATLDLDLAPGAFINGQQIQALGLSEVPGQGHTPGDTFYVFAEVDTTNELAESNNSNNRSGFEPFMLDAPDVFASALSALPGSGTGGSSFEYSYQLGNSGTLAVNGGFEDQLWLSRDATLTTAGPNADTLWLTLEREDLDLAPGVTIGEVTDGVLPVVPELEGTVFLIYSADRGNTVLELDDANNVAVLGSFQYGVPKPDLTVTGLSAPSEVVVGQPFTVTYTTENVGTDDTMTPWREQQDTKLGEDVLATREFLDVNVLAAGGTRPRTLSDFVIVDSGGLHTIEVTADSQDALNESNETNNTASVQVNVVGPDLVVENVVVTGETQPGGVLDVSFDVVNLGQTTASGVLHNDVTLRRASDDGQVTPGGGTEPISISAGGTRMFSVDLLLPNNSSVLGEMTVRVDTNFDGAIAEINPENNRATSGMFRVGAPDLVVDLPNPISPVRLGDDLTLEYRITNQGDRAVDAASVRTLGGLSADDMVGGDRTFATMLGEAVMLEPGESMLSEVTGRVAIGSLPTGVTGVGTVYAVAFTDVSGAVVELDETNNTSGLLPFTLNAPDLSASPADPLESAAVAGDSFAFSYTTTNVGNAAAAGGYLVRFWLSDDAVFSPSTDTLIGDDRIVDGLAVGASVETETTQTVPLTEGLLGTKHLFVDVNADNDSPEFNRENNRVGLGMFEVVRPDAPDLVVASASIASEGIATEAVEVCWTEENVGTEAATEAWTTELFLASLDPQTDPSYTSTLVQIGEFSFVDGLDVGASVERCEQVTLPDVSGPRWLVVRVDTDGTVDEPFRENNNERAEGMIEVIERPRPDLVVTNVRPLGQQLRAEDVFSGSLTEVEFTVTNEGTGPTSTPIWTDGIYLSTDAAVGNDVFLGRKENPIYLEPGESYTSTEMVQLPSDNPGSFTIRVLTDDQGRVEELAEGNNDGFSPSFPVLLEPQPDLVVDAVPTLSPEAAFSGLPLTVSWTETNSTTAEDSGGRPDVPTWRTYVYLSDNDQLSVTGDTLLTNVGRTGGVLEPGASEARSATVTLPENIAGPRYVKVLVDGDNRVSEFGLEGNNLTVSEMFNVTLSLPVNLTPTFVETQPTVLPGNTFAVVIGGQNLGAPARQTISWEDAVYLSEDDVLDGSDLRLGTTFARSVSGEFEPYEAQRTIRLPDSIAPGVYTPILVVDDTGAVDEGVFGEDDNVLVGGPMIGAPALVVEDRYAELGVTATPVQGAVDPGSAVQISWVVTNGGDAPTPVSSWRDRIWFSADPSLGGDTALTSRTQNGVLLPGGAYGATRTIVVPQVGPGRYYVLIQVDDRNEVLERSERGTQNVLAVPVDVTGDASDLIVAGVVADAQVNSGETMGVQWTVENVGTRGTDRSAWYDRVRLVDHGRGGSVIASRRVTRTGSLDSGGMYTGAATLSVPIDAEGPFGLEVETDETELVFEGNEGNNFANGSVVVDLTDPANLVASDVSGPSGGGAGQPVTVTWVVANEGAGPPHTSGWRDRVYLSRDETFSGGDLLIGSVAPASVPGPGEQYAGELTANLPASASGEYFFIVRTDGSRDVFEGGAEDDNTAVSDTMISVLTADLDPESVGGSESAIAGQPIDLEWTVRNTGASPTPVSSWRDAVYLSRNQFIDGGDVFLGSWTRSGGLMPDESYTQSRSATLPAGISGPYHVIVRTDSSSQVPEGSDAAGNDLPSSTLVEVELPEPTDLVASGIGVPSQAGIGTQAPFSWSIDVNELAGSGTGGRWTDSLFLSEDDRWDPSDVFVGRFDNVPSGALEPGDSSAVALSARIPAVLPGPYFLVVRGDALNQIPETDENNNTEASAEAFEVTATPLTLGETFADAFPSQQDRYFQVDVPAGKTLRVSFDHDSPDAFSELFIRRDDVPTAGQFDFVFDAPGEPSQSLVISDTQAARYYILARARGITPSPSGVQGRVLAELLPFSVLDSGPEVVGAGEVTLSVTGAQMPDETAFSLEDSLRGGGVTPLQTVALGNGRFELTFDLAGLEGEFDLRAVSGENESVFAGAVEVESEAQAWVRTELQDVAQARVGTARDGRIVVTNFGTTDVQASELLLALPALGDGAVDLVLYPDDPSRTVMVTTRDTALEELASARLFIGRLRPGQSVAVPYRIVFNVGIGVPFGMSLGASSPTRAGFLETQALEVVLDARLAMEEHLLGLGVEEADVLVAGGDFEASARRVLESLSGAALTTRGLSVCETAAAEAAWRSLRGEARLPVDYYLDWLPALAGCVCPEGLCGASACAECAGVGAAIESYLRCCADESGCGTACSEFLRPRISFDPVEVGRSDSGSTLEPCSGGDVGSGPDLSPGGHNCYPPPVESIDPNEVSGPIGTGDEQWVSSRVRLRYRVYFENIDTASAPAADVNIDVPLPLGFAAGSFRAEGVTLGTGFEENDLSSFIYQDSGTATAETGREVGVDVTGAVDPSDTMARVGWSFGTTDPDTGEPPLDPFDGFLPRNDENGIGEGYVDFTIVPSPGAVTGERVEVQASIVFDTNEPIITNTVFNTIDADVPISFIDVPPPLATTSLVIPMTISAEDPAGSGLAGARVFVSTDGGPYEEFQELSMETLAVFEAEPGRLYAFATQAEDLAGNVERLPFFPDAVTVTPTLGLNAASDTGLIGDEVTFDSTPTVDVVSLPGRAITVVFDGPVMREVVAFTDGLGRASATVADAEALADGEYVVSVDHGGVVTELVLTIEAAPAFPLEWVSRADHGAAGPLEVPLEFGAFRSDSREGGVGALRVSLTQAIDPGSLSGATVALAAVGADGSAIDVSATKASLTLDPAGIEVGVRFDPPLPSPSRACVGIEGLRTVAGVLVENLRIDVSSAPGDVTGDGRVNASDVAFVRGLESQGLPGVDPADAVQVRADVNRDGVIDGLDTSAVRTARGLDLRVVASPCPASPNSSRPMAGGRADASDASDDTVTTFAGGSGVAGAAGPAGTGDGADGTTTGEGPRAEAPTDQASALALLDATRLAVRDAEDEQAAWTVLTVPTAGREARARALEEDGLLVGGVVVDADGTTRVVPPELLVRESWAEDESLGELRAGESRGGWRRFEADAASLNELARLADSINGRAGHDAATLNWTRIVTTPRVDGPRGGVDLLVLDPGAVEDLGAAGLTRALALAESEVRVGVAVSRDSLATLPSGGVSLWTVLGVIDTSDAPVVLRGWPDSFGVLRGSGVHVLDGSVAATARAAAAGALASLDLALPERVRVGGRAEEAVSLDEHVRREIRSVRPRVDVDGDGVLGRSDVQALVDAVAVGDTAVGDINGDGVADRTDLGLLLEAMARPTLPVRPTEPLNEGRRRESLSVSGGVSR